MSIEVRTKIKFAPWSAPNYARLDNRTDGGDRENHTIPVNELDEYALAALAEAWIEDLYGKTEHKSPFQITPLP